MLRMPIAENHFAFLGAGIIAGVFIERLIKAAGIAPENVLATDVRPERLEELRDAFGIATSPHNEDGAAFADILFLAVPPPAVKGVLAGVRTKIRPDVLVVSLAAAVPIALMQEALGQPNPVVRLIPNTPSLVGRGMNPHSLGKHVAPAHILLIDQLLGVFGETLRVEERLMNVVTALTAVGPTYLFPVLKALSDAACRLGLPAGEAQRAAALTVAGAAQLVLETGRKPDDLMMMIGTRTLREDDARALFDSALVTAFEKITAVETKLARQ